METTQETPLPCPYEAGAQFHLCVTPTASFPYEVRVTVIHAFTPFTISPAMRVSLDTLGASEPDNACPPVELPSEMILKVYDRRFAQSLREYYKGKPPTYKSEARYQEYLASGPAADSEELDDQISEVCPSAGYEGCPSHLFEHLIAFAVRPYYENESAAYERLTSLQGRSIPMFYGSVRILDGRMDTLLQGVLIEAIPGIGLDKADPALINIDKAVRNAMQIVDSYYDLGLLNEDVRLGNFIVKPDGSVVMIDFAQSRLREEDESDEDWRLAKQEIDEEGCIGFAAQKKFNWPWVRGQKYSTGASESRDTGTPVEDELNPMNIDGGVEVTSDSEAVTESEEMSDWSRVSSRTTNATSVVAGEDSPISCSYEVGPNIPLSVSPPTEIPDPNNIRVAVSDELESESRWASESEGVDQLSSESDSDGTSTPVEGKSDGVDLGDQLNQANTGGELDSIGRSDVAGDSEGMSEGGEVLGQMMSATSVTGVQGTPIPCPYEIGARFHLGVFPLSGTSYEIHTTVLDTFAPFTISPVMRVALDSDQNPPVDLPHEMILKVYDRRFAQSLREYYKGKPATYESEAQYQRYLASGPAADPEELDDQISDVCPTAGYEGCPPDLFEHLITFAMSPHYESECAAYERLASLQGRDIPRFYGSVKVLNVDVDPPVQGVLLEVVPGTSLDKADPASVNIDAAVRNAMRIVDSYYDLGLLNEDVHLGNFIVRLDGSVVMIDFAQSRLREDDESDEDWREAKEGADEEGCIGFKAMKKFGWPWVRGQKYHSRLTELDEADRLDGPNETTRTSNPAEGESEAMDLVEEISEPNEEGETQLDGTGEVESGEMLGQISNDASAKAAIPHSGVIDPNISSRVSLIAAPEPYAADITLEGAGASMEGKSNGINLLDESNQPIGEGQSNGTSQSVVAGDVEATSNPDGVSESEGTIGPSRVSEGTTNPTSVGTVKGAPIRHSSSLGLNISLFVPHLHKMHAAAVGKAKSDSDEVD